MIINSNTTFSGSFTEINKSALKAFSFQQPAEARKTRLSQTHGFCFIDSKGQLGILSSCHWFIKPDGSKLLIGSRGELLDHCVPSSVPDDPFCPNHFVSLATLEMVTLMDLPHFPTTRCDPCHVEPPEGTDANRDIHWPTPADEDFPVFSVFPTIFPLLEGVVLPDTINLKHPFPATWPDATPLEFVAWLRAFKYILDHNSGKSLHAHTQMFKASRIPAAASFDKLEFVTDPTIAAARLNFGSSEYAFVRKSFDQAREVAYLRVFAQSMKEIVENSKMTSSERERKQYRKQSQQDAMLQWRILLAHVSANDSVEPAELSPVFIGILQQENRSVAVKNYRREFSKFLATKRAQDPDNFVYRQATHIEEAVTHVFVLALQSFNVMNRGWINNVSEEIKTQLCVAHFFPNPVKSAVFTEYVRAGQRVLQQEAMEDKSKTDAKQLELFYQGSISSPSDVVSTICNLIVTFDFMIADMKSKPPFFLKPIRGMLDAIQSDSGRDWLSKYSSVDYLYVSLATSLQNLLVPFVGITSNPIMRRALAANQPLQLCHYVHAQQCTKRTVERLYHMITTGTLGMYRERPNLAFLLDSESTTKKHDSPSGSNAATSPAKKQKKDNEQKKHDASSEPTRNKTGLLHYTKDGHPPYTSVTTYHPTTGNKARLCTFFLFKNLACKHDSCRRVHLKKLANLSEEKRHELIQYVNTTDGVEWIRGPS
jgi:hypothetical protein